MATLRMIVAVFLCCIGELTTASHWEEQLGNRVTDMMEADGRIAALSRDFPSQDSNEFVPQDEFDQEIASLQSTLDEFNGDVAQISKDFASQTQEFNSDFIRLETIVNRLKSDNQLVGFTAYNTGEVRVYDYQTIIFTSVKTNHGGGYNPSNGVFTCPVSGMYFFSISTFSMKGSHNQVQFIIDNGSYTVAGTAAYADSSHYDQGSNSWIIHCSKNNKVYMRSRHSGETKIAAGWGSGTIHNGFSGFLIRKTD